MIHQIQALNYLLTSLSSTSELMEGTDGDARNKWKFFFLMQKKTIQVGVKKIKRVIKMERQRSFEGQNVSHILSAESMRSENTE